MIKNLINLIRPDLRENFKPYSSAASEMGKREGAVYLNANENPYPFEGLEGLERYALQQPVELIEAIAKAYHVPKEYIVTTRGSDESLDLLIRIFCTFGRDAILTCPPTFAMYGVYANLQGAKNIQVPLIEKDGTAFLDQKRIIDTVKSGQNNIKLVFLCCPNSPTGNLFSPEVIEEIISELNGYSAVVVDEAYIDFADQPSFSKNLEDYPNLLVLRTLSKVHALAGERVGSTLCADTDFTAFMRGCLAPYPVPKSVAANAVEALRQAETKRENMIAKIIAGRERLSAAFAASDQVEMVYPSQTNFLLVKFKSYDAAQSFLKKALEENIILRDISSKVETANCLRISVGSESENACLSALL